MDENGTMVHWRRNLALVWTAQFLATAGFCFATPFIPFYIKEIGVSEQAQVSLWAALFVAAGNLALLLSAPCWGFISDIYGRRLMVLRASFVCGLLMPLMAFVPGLLFWKPVPVRVTLLPPSEVPVAGVTKVSVGNAWYV